MEEIEFNRKSIQEFSRVLLENVSIENVEFYTKELDGQIEVLAKVENRESLIKADKFKDIPCNQKLVMAKSCLLKLFNKYYEWGSMTGVRPTKIIHKMLKDNLDINTITKALRQVYLVSDEKIKLLNKVVKTESSYLNSEFSNLYIGIPYCPTKCTYCSFASYEKNSKTKKYYMQFFEKLLLEIDKIGKIIREKSIKVESIYIGGGTPAILSEKELEQFMHKIYLELMSNYVKELNFEAGRTDVLTKEKLAILKKYGVDRICLNPQTFKNSTLKKVNRTFEIEKFDELFLESKKLGFIINMDIIIGLPEENTSDIIETIEKISKYDLDNLTIHMLAIKRASQINEYNFEKLNKKIIQNKIQQVVKEKQLNSYYLYRQKNSISWGENIGYSKIGRESIFNIQMIEESQNTIGIGGGAISKFLDGEQITRLINPKDPTVYVNEFEQRLEKKLDKLKKMQ